MKLKGSLSFIWEIAQIVIIALVIVLPIRYFVFQPFIVKGASMEPNFQNGDYLIVDELSYRFREPERGEVIVFKYPQDPDQRFIKRIVGLPKEQIELVQGRIVITDKFGDKVVLSESDYLPLLSTQLLLGKKKIVLAEDEYFVLGDNRGHSFDSRNWGSLDREEIVGRALLRAWPFSGFGFIQEPTY